MKRKTVRGTLSGKRLRWKYERHTNGWFYWNLYTIGPKRKGGGVLVASFKGALFDADGNYFRECVE